MQGAVLYAIHLDDGRVFDAPPSSKEGQVGLRELPFGYFEFAIDSSGVLYAVTRPAQANPAKTLKLDFRLIPPSPPASGAVTIETGVPVPSLGRQATAVAEIVGGDKDQKSRARLRNIAIIGGAILLLILVA